MPDIIESPPLQHHKRYKTRDIETIHEAVADILVPHKVEVSRSGELDREAVLHHAPLPNGAIIYLPLSGASTTYCGDGRVASRAGQGVVAGPYQQFATEWTVDCSKLLIKLESNALENYLSTLLGRRQIRALDFSMVGRRQIRALDFSMAMDLSSATSASLLRTVKWILGELDQPDSLVNTATLAGQQYQRMLMWTLLHCQPNNYSEELAARQPPQVPHYIPETEAYIQAHYAEPISLEQLVEHAHVSERTLLEGFKRYRDVSPMKLLKLTRLDFVHLALKEADPAISNVTDIALGNGFSQLGKFSTEYKERFGESPSETLKGDSAIRT
jgi:AraC-like DNA-binding protein